MSFKHAFYEVKKYTQFRKDQKKGFSVINLDQLQIEDKVIFGSDSFPLSQG